MSRNEALLVIIYFLERPVHHMRVVKIHDERNFYQLSQSMECLHKIQTCTNFIFLLQLVPSTDTNALLMESMIVYKSTQYVFIMKQKHFEVKSSYDHWYLLYISKQYLNVRSYS